MKRNWKQRVALVGSWAAVGATAMAQTNDVTTIYSGAQSHFTASTNIALGAIAIGTAIYFIRKGLKSRA